MKNITITAKVRIYPSSEAGLLLRETMSVYTDACNFVSDYIFTTHELNRIALHKALYRKLRARFNLGAQMAQSVLITVSARYKTILTNEKKWIKPSFSKMQCDFVRGRDYSFTKDLISLKTLTGRIKVSWRKKDLDRYPLGKLGTARLLIANGKYFLHIPVTIEAEEPSADDISNVVGIDRGINFTAVSYDSAGRTEFYNGRTIKQKRAQYARTRKELQKCGTPSSRRRLKAIGNRENRWMRDVNHCISKALVSSAKPHTLFVLEDLSGIRNATEKVRTKDRYVSVSWSFNDLGAKLQYKAELSGCKVMFVPPEYTSQDCPICGHRDKTNRDKKMHRFTCKCCGYQSNDDRVGAMNIRLRGIDELNKQISSLQNSPTPSLDNAGKNEPSQFASVKTAS